MADDISDRTALAEAVAEIRREFVAGLPARLSAMREALEGIVQRFDPDLALQVYVRAHALAGTAAALNAPAVAEPASVLVDHLHRWRRGNAPNRAEITHAMQTLGTLDRAAEEMLACDRERQS